MSEEKKIELTCNLCEKEMYRLVYVEDKDIFAGWLALCEDCYGIVSTIALSNNQKARNPQ